MKFQLSIFIVLFAAIGLLTSCSSDKDKSVRDAARQSLPQTVTAPPPAPTTSTTPPPAPETGVPGQMHYICPNNCESSGGPAAGTCPVCGTAYTHNQAWHGQQNTAVPPTTTTTTTPTTPTTIPTPTQVVEPPQNADGVWHYICPSGCTGGGGSAAPCGTCGATLAHNTAYHN